MNFMPAIPMPFVSGLVGWGGIAANADGTLFASVHNDQHCVYIYSVGAADPVVIGTAGTRGSAHGRLNYPLSVCFVHRNGADTLLICDTGNDRVVEVSASGVFLRVIAVEEASDPWGIAYCDTSDVIAVSLFNAHAVVLLQYESGAVKPEVSIGSGIGASNGQLGSPRGVAFTADGRYILVADYWNNCVSKFSAASGAFIAHVATYAANGIGYPRDVLQCDDGSIVVGYDGCMSHVGVDGVTVKNTIIPRDCGRAMSLCWLVNDVVVKTREGGVFVLRDAWFRCKRCAWLSAICAT